MQRALVGPLLCIPLKWLLLPSAEMGAGLPQWCGTRSSPSWPGLGDHGLPSETDPELLLTKCPRGKGQHRRLRTSG